MSNNDPIRGTGSDRLRRIQDGARRAWWSKPAFIGAAVIVAGGVIVAGLAIAGRLADDEPAPSTPPQAGSTTAPTTPADGSCNAMEDNSTSLTPPIPEDLSWAALNGETWPVSPSYGPTAEENELGVCFSNSPMGAVLAATSLQMAVLAGVDGQTILDTYVMDGPGKDIVEARGYNPQANNGTFQLAGFRVASFVDDRAQVHVVFSADGAPTGYLATPIDLQWTGDDWKGVFSDSGEAAPLSNPSEGEFTEWRGNDG